MPRKPAPENVSPKLRLLADCFTPDGVRRERGDVVEWIWPDVKPPHRAAQRTLDRISYDPADGLDANRLLGNVEDVPLFEIVTEEEG